VWREPGYDYGALGPVPCPQLFWRGGEGHCERSGPLPPLFWWTGLCIGREPACHHWLELACHFL
ncbi:hypothetical protein BGZ51_008709, partial [Haplosporangium sp. Z 767]